MNMPPGFEQIEQMRVAPLPFVRMNEYTLSVTRERASQAIGRAMMAGGRFQPAGSMMNVPNALELGAIAAVGYAADRHSKASESLTSATEFANQVKKFGAEATGLRDSFAKLRTRADDLCGTMSKAMPFFERYIGPSEAIHASGRTWEQLEDGERLTVQYPARMTAFLAAAAQETLA